MDTLKTQIITMFGLRNAMNPASANSSGDGIMTAVYAIFLLTMIESLFKYLPIIMAFILANGERLLRRKVLQSNIPIIKNAINEVNSIILVRNYVPTNSGDQRNQQIFGNSMMPPPDNDLVDALIDYITNLDCCKHLRFTTRFFLNNTEDIKITPEIRIHLEEYLVESDGTVSKLIIRLYSDILNVHQMREFVEKIHRNYMNEKKNKFGNQRFFFNEIQHHIDRNFDGTMRLGNQPKKLNFGMIPFNTFKSMANIFGDHLAEIKERVKLFTSNPDWYKERGIPHTLGIMLYGKPGCGKTSVIKALAKDTNRHIFNISLRENTTQRQLSNLFFEETVSIQNEDGQHSTVIIPLDQRIYVIEDIDCLTNVVYDRNLIDDTETIAPLSDEQRVILNSYYDSMILELEEKHATKEKPIPVPTPVSVPAVSFVSLNEAMPEVCRSFEEFNKFWESSEHPDLNNMLVDAYDGGMGKESSFGKERSFVNNLNDLYIHSNMVEKPVVANESDELPIEEAEQFIELQRFIHVFDVSSVAKILDIIKVYPNLGNKAKQWIIKSPVEYYMRWLEHGRANMGLLHPTYVSFLRDILAVAGDSLPKQSGNGGGIGGVAGVDSTGKLSDDAGAKLAKEDQKKELITLSYLLNLLDGVLETPGRIIIITSNYPEKLDKALIRPGRIDIKIRFDYASCDMIREMLRNFYNIASERLATIDISPAINKKYSPAQVIEAFCNNYNNYAKALDVLNVCE